MMIDEADAGGLPFPSDVDTLIGAGRAAIAGEASALWALAGSVDMRFAEAIGLLVRTRGRIVVAGLGKSGAVAAKIAASFAATGRPALFVHAGDALHGDLGMLCPGDTLLLLSKAGQTRECSVLAATARRQRIPVIAITTAAGSALASLADVLLLLPNAPEVCPLGLSPTSSTTMMLAMGDALVVVAMRVGGITAETIRQLHPGGATGRDLVPIAGFMHRGAALPLVRPSASLPAVLACMAATGFGIALVASDAGDLLGVITDGDIRRQAGAALPARHAAAMMSAPGVAIRSDAVAGEALAMLRDGRITALPVIDAAVPGRIAGLVHLHDLLQLGGM